MRRIPLTACILQLPLTLSEIGLEIVGQSRPRRLTSDYPGSHGPSAQNALRCYDDNPCQKRDSFTWSGKSLHDGNQRFTTS